MNPQPLLGDQNLELIEFGQKQPLEPSDEACTSVTAKIERGQDDDLIEIQPAASQPDAL